LFRYVVPPSSKCSAGDAGVVAVVVDTTKNNYKATYHMYTTLANHSTFAIVGKITWLWYM
jgi:hypothetical protein